MIGRNKNPWISLALLFSLNLYAHEGKKHMAIKKDNSKVHIQKINQEYLKQVKPIFQNKCFNCHSSETKFPWYYKLPLVKEIVDSDIKEAKKHLDMSNDFPFDGHGSPVEDLRELEETVQKGDMPPLNYKIMHWGSSLTKKDKDKIMGWTKNSIKLIGN